MTFIRCPEGVLMARLEGAAPCVCTDANNCDRSCVACWAPETSLNPGPHVFEISVRVRSGSPRGEYFSDVEPFVVETRGSSLRQALLVATEVPLQYWASDASADNADRSVDESPEPPVDNLALHIASDVPTAEDAAEAPRCRCGTIVSAPNPRCGWHQVAYARWYAASVLRTLAEGLDEKAAASAGNDREMQAERSGILTAAEVVEETARLLDPRNSVDNPHPVRSGRVAHLPADKYRVEPKFSSATSLGQCTGWDVYAINTDPSFT